MEQLTQPLSPAGHSPDVRGIPKLPAMSSTPDMAPSCECNPFSSSLTRVWPSHWVSSLCQHTQRLPNICSVSQFQLMWRRRHWVAWWRAFPNGGWLSRRMWADSCPGVWRNERWRAAGRTSLPALLSQEEGGQLHLANGWYSQKWCSSESTAVEGEGGQHHTENSDDTCKRSNRGRPLPANERDKCIALGRAHGYTFPIQVVSRKCLIKWLALNKPKWAAAKWLIPAREKKEKKKIIAWKIC